MALYKGSTKISPIITVSSGGGGGSSVNLLTGIFAVQNVSGYPPMGYDGILDDFAANFEMSITNAGTTTTFDGYSEDEFYFEPVITNGFITGLNFVNATPVGSGDVEVSNQCTGYINGTYAAVDIDNSSLTYNEDVYEPYTISCELNAYRAEGGGFFAQIGAFDIVFAPFVQGV